MGLLPKAGAALALLLGAIPTRANIPLPSNSSLLFSQTATSLTIVPDPANASSLSLQLRGLSPITTFTVPLRRADRLPTAAFLRLVPGWQPATVLLFHPASHPTDTHYLAVRVLAGAYNGSAGTAVYSARTLLAAEAASLDSASNAAFYLSDNASGAAAQALDAQALGAAFYDVSLAFDTDPGWCVATDGAEEPVAEVDLLARRLLS
ncbi:hypothetical protein WJX81_003705 [Elliptochloris bilobata]